MSGVRHLLRNPSRSKYVNLATRAHPYPSTHLPTHPTAHRSLAALIHEKLGDPPCLQDHILPNKTCQDSQITEVQPAPLWTSVSHTVVSSYKIWEHSRGEPSGERNPASRCGLKQTSLESHTPGLAIIMVTVSCTNPATPGPAPSHPALVKDRLLIDLYSRYGNRQTSRPLFHPCF